MNHRGQPSRRKPASASVPKADGPKADGPKAIRLRLIALLVAAASFVGGGLYLCQTHYLVNANDKSPHIAPPSFELAVGDLNDVDSQTRPAGMPLPETLLTKPSDNQTFWYVGKPTTESLVEIPFPPGTLPGPPVNLPPMRENPGFLGAQACRSCHENKYESFIQTAHHQTSQPATPDAVAGSLGPGKNQLPTVNPDLNFTMVRRDSRAYQKVQFYDWEFEVPFDLIIGSSKLAQTFLYWDFDALYQMNVTYLKETDCWINSPGYFDGDAAYARPIHARCFECHSTYADFRAEPNHFTPQSIIFGISCERCHGPGRSHVDYHRQHPTDKSPQFVVVPSKLSRERELDVCGQCHSGASFPKGLPYSFRPGDRLEDHYQPLSPEKIRNSVHASNQASRLAMSKCFLQSDMACSDCHDPHRMERGQLAMFSERCLKCHSPQDCGQTIRLGDRIRENCIDCHMPSGASENLRLETIEGDVFPPLRDHLIRVDSGATKRFYEKATINAP